MPSADSRRAAGPSTAGVGTRAVTVLGVFLLLGNGYYGIHGRSAAWPLACYPTFSRLAPPYASTVRIEVIDAEGRARQLDDLSMMRHSSVARWKNMLGSILALPDGAARRNRLTALWSVWIKSDPSLAEARIVRFYRVTTSTAPEARGNAPLSRELLWEMTPSGSD